MIPSEILRRKFSFSKSELLLYAATCPYRYKKYPIDKRNGQGTRVIAQPSKDLKAVQRVLLDEYFSKRINVHNCATAYKKGCSILTNAKPHLSNRFLLKMDFKDFFPSIKMSDFDNYLSSKNILNEPDERALVGLIYFMKSGGDNVLSIGSPGSPTISNAVLFDFDQKVHELCEKSGVCYTRYSDDLTFSTNEKNLLFKWPAMISGFLDDLEFPNISINENKTVFSSKKFNRHVTGITITNDSKASLGRAKKREIRTRVYLAGKGTLSFKEVLSLKGYISFAKGVEPHFVESLWNKYPVEMLKIFSQMP